MAGVKSSGVSEAEERRLAEERAQVTRLVAKRLWDAASDLSEAAREAADGAGLDEAQVMRAVKRVLAAVHAQDQLDEGIELGGALEIARTPHRVTVDWSYVWPVPS